MPAPNFSTVFVDALRLGTRNRGWRAMVPWSLIATLAPLAPALYFETDLKEALTNKDLTPLFAAILVMGGFLGALSINAMASVFSILTETKFAAYLKAESIFDQFLFWPQYTLLIQIFLIFFSATSIVVFLLLGLSTLTILVASANLGFMAYTVFKTWGLVDLQRRLAWHRQDFLECLENAIEAALEKQRRDSGAA